MCQSPVINPFSAWPEATLRSPWFPDQSRIFWDAEPLWSFSNIPPPRQGVINTTMVHAPSLKTGCNIKGLETYAQYFAPSPFIFSLCIARRLFCHLHQSFQQPLSSILDKHTHVFILIITEDQVPYIIPCKDPSTLHGKIDPVVGCQNLLATEFSVASTF